MIPVYWIKAETQEGTDLCLLVAAHSPTQAIRLWQNYFAGWDEDNNDDRAVHKLPLKAEGAPRAIDWGDDVVFEASFKVSTDKDVTDQAAR